MAWKVWWWICWAVCLLLAGSQEFSRLHWALQSPAGVFSWFTDWNAETTLPFVLLMALPCLLWMPSAAQAGRHRGRELESREVSPLGTRSASHSWQVPLAAAILFAVSLGASASIGDRPIKMPGQLSEEVMLFADLPPAYHDEYSYLLQAQTFLAGRLSWPAMAVQPELFHQVHVLSEPRTASRYFPWTGLWMAPFVALEHPVRGHWLAGAIACVFLYLSLNELMGYRAAVWGGLLIAVSPGMAVFSNLLLAHHPTMLALSVFLWAFLKQMRSERTRYAWIAGVALALAMLGRPMTAAGFALPFGVWMLSLLVRRRADGETPPIRRLYAAMAIPLLAGIGVLLMMNREITGDWLVSPYQYYTDHWTPAHGYGFDNVRRGAALRRDGNVMAAYDAWATNLTPAIAANNVVSRFRASVMWSLGLIPVVLGLLMATPLVWTSRVDRRFRLLWCSVLSLHLVHVPYWFDGILHWHYVFESAPLLLILCIPGFCEVIELLSESAGRRRARLWVGCLMLTAVLPGWMDLPAGWGLSKVSMAVSEQSWSRVRMHQFRQLVESAARRHPALILVDERGADPQLSFVVNPPDFRSDVLVCRYPENASVLQELQKAFADRTIYVFNPQTFELSGL